METWETKAPTFQWSDFSTGSRPEPNADGDATRYKQYAELPFLDPMNQILFRVKRAKGTQAAFFLEQRTQGDARNKGDVPFKTIKA